MHIDNIDCNFHKLLQKLLHFLSSQSNLFIYIYYQILLDNRTPFKIIDKELNFSNNYF